MKFILGEKITLWNIFTPSEKIRGGVHGLMGRASKRNILNSLWLRENGTQYLQIK
jgi:hypothetical protein